MESRDTYQDIKNLFLLNMFDLCKDYNQLKGKNNYNYSSFIAIIDDDFLNTYDSAIENLMFKVVGLILTAGLDDNLVNYFKNEINKILNSNDIDYILKDIPEEEALDLLQDMKKLKLL